MPKYELVVVGERYVTPSKKRMRWLLVFRKGCGARIHKTCALGMGGQAGGTVNESGHFPEVCKKSFQAMLATCKAEFQMIFLKHIQLHSSVNLHRIRWSIQEGLCHSY